MAARRKKDPGAGSGDSGRSLRAGPLDTTRLSAAIAASGFDWTAAEGEITRLAATDPGSLLGLVVDAAEMRATESAIRAAESMQSFRAAAIAAPAKIDWRNKGGNYVTPIRNQQSCGSCVAFATIATIESRMNVACKRTTAAKDLSEAHLFFCGCGNCCGTGWNFVPALTFCQIKGVALESSFPYTPSNQPCKTTAPIAFKISGFTTLLTTADRKNAIANGGPVVAGMAVYQDFFSYRSGVYRHVSGNLSGYHAVSIVGYDDAAGCWIAKNSWGSGWGDNGFFRIAYGQCGIDSQFPFFAPIVPCEAPKPVNRCVAYRPVLLSVLSAARLNPALRACLRWYVCRRGFPVRCTPAVLVLVRQVLAVLRACPSYRASFCRSLG